MRTSLKQTGALLLSVAALLAAGLTPDAEPSRSVDRRPNVIVILTDDQPFDTLPTEPPAMPYLQGRIEDPDDHWLWFSRAFVNTPICCPSRATILSGLYSHHTGVRRNGDGGRFDESSTIATWLHEAGYTTGLVGKYLNRYPFDRGPYVPAGWDRFIAKRNTSAATVYQGYELIDQGVSMRVSAARETYATDLLTDRAVGFVRVAPASRPFFLLFAPSAPHRPWLPAPRHRGAFAGVALEQSQSFDEANVSEKPRWVRALGRLRERRADALLAQRRRVRATLLGVDDAVRRIMAAVRARGELDRTVVFFLTDNGFAFGEHRIVGKRCPYDECVRTPFAVRVPWMRAETLSAVVSNADLAPTIADLARTAYPAVDGESLVPLFVERRDRRRPGRPGVLIGWAGDAEVPAWWGIRTARFAYIESVDGTIELYDLAGGLGPPDPAQMDNRARDPRYGRVLARLAGTLAELRSLPPDRR